MERPDCPRCRAEKPAKNGWHLGRQRWKCKACSFAFTQTTPRGKPRWMKQLALHLYQSRMSINGIARLFGVSGPAVLKWLRESAKQVVEKPSPGSVQVVEIDEVWHFLGKKTESCGSGWLLIAVKSASLTGKSAIVAELP